MSIAVNGQLVHFSRWRVTEIGPDDEVHIWKEPKGIDPISITIAAIKSAQALFRLFMPRIKMPSTQNPRQGDPLESARTKANQVRYGDIVREAFGRNKIYPDYIVPQCRRFPSERTEWVQMLLAVGIGDYEIHPSDIMIGDTPIISLGDNARYRIYRPGESVSGDPAAEWWHSVAEVGATATGTAGIDLRTTTTVDQSANAQAYQFDGDLVTVPVGAGQFPTGWAAGMIVRVEVMYQYNVTAGTGVGGRDTISGPLAQLGAFPGMVIEVTGANEGIYVVNSYTAPAGSTPASMTLNTTSGAPVSGLQYGTGWACIGYRGLRYRITAASSSQLALDRLTDTGSDDIAWPGFDYIESNSAVLKLDGSTLEETGPARSQGTRRPRKPPRSSSTTCSRKASAAWIRRGDSSIGRSRLSFSGATWPWPAHGPRTERPSAGRLWTRSRSRAGSTCRMQCAPRSGCVGSVRNRPRPPSRTPCSGMAYGPG